VTARRACLAAGIAVLVALPAAAQQIIGTATSIGNTGTSAGTGPVDLLATIATTSGADNSSAGARDAASPTIGSIDEAIEAISGGADSAGDTAGDTAGGAAAPASASMTGSVSVTPPVSDATGMAATRAVSGTGQDSMAEGAGTATAAVSLTRGPVVTSFGIADIGLEPSGGDDAGLTATIWRGTPVDRATVLLDSDAVIGASPALSSLAHRIVAHRAVPPVGAGDTAETLVTARLDWLAAAGRSEVLEELVAQLPNDPPWLAWKQWLVETQLMSRRDEEACRNVMYQVSRTFEPFWHKAKVICSAAKGDIAGAQFAADILKAMGVDDAAFSALVSTLLNGTAPGALDPALLDPLHIVLMDAAHADIDTSGLAALSEGSVQTAIGLRYLDPEARLVSTWRALDRGLIAHEKAAKLWRGAKITPDDVALALARHRSQPSALTRALAWRALDAEKTPRRLAFTAAMMDVDIASGAGLMMAPLYAELVREALGFDGAAEALAADPALAGKLGMLVSIGDTGDLPDALATPEVRAARGLLRLAGGMANANLAPLGTLQMWHMLPLVEQATLTVEGNAAARDWIGLAMPAAVTPASYLSVSPLMIRALEQAAATGRIAETVLLAHRILGTLDLAQIHPADAARIVAALSAAGQQDTANAFAGEVVAAHLMTMMQAVEIALPVRTDVAAGSDTSTDAGDGGEVVRTGANAPIDAAADADAVATAGPGENAAPQQDANDDS